MQPPFFRSRNPLPSLEAGTLRSLFYVFQSAVKAQYPAFPEVVAQSFPGQGEIEEDSEWVAAAAAPHGGVSPEGIWLVWGLVGGVAPSFSSPHVRAQQREGPFSPAEKSGVGCGGGGREKT